MKDKYHKQFLSLVIVAIVLGGLSATTANAGYPILFGESLEKVTNATTKDTDIFRGNTVETSFRVGSADSPYPAGLLANKTYYWRIDEVNDLHPDSPWKGEVWSFTVAPLSATAPGPMSGSLFADPNGVLTWTVGAGAVQHHVYLGDNLQAVQAGAGGQVIRRVGWPPSLPRCALAPLSSSWFGNAHHPL